MASPRATSAGVRAIALGAIASVAIASSVTARAACQRARFAELHRMLPAEAELSESLALGDLDGDGDLDLLLGNASRSPWPGAQNRLWLNDGDGRFVDATTLLYPAIDFTRSLALGDVDGDGDLDAVVGNAEFPPLPNRLMLNDGTGRFIDATHRMPQEPIDTAALALGDLDGDGDLDLVIGTQTPSSAPSSGLVWSNDGTGRFSPRPDATPTGVARHLAVALGDLDGDGDLDATFVCDQAPSWLWLNDGKGRFTDASARLPQNRAVKTSIALGDVDRDSDLDMLIGGWLGPTLLWINDGAGNFSRGGARIPAHTGYTRAVGLRDLDGDGDLDALLGNSYEPHRLWLNDGAGWFADAPAPDDVVQLGAMSFGDVDTDGDVDIVFATWGQSRLWLNDGSARFADVTDPVPYSQTATASVGLGDLDRDGDLDVLFGTDATRGRMWLNDGAGHFTDASRRLPTMASLPAVAALGDVDGDADLDVLVASGATATRRALLWLNDGQGTFGDASERLPVATPIADAVALVDVDGDGDADALLASRFDAPCAVWLNDGSGRFLVSTRVPVLTSQTAIAAADVDADGDVDILWGGYLATSLWLNDGAGGFRDASSQLPPARDSARGVALGDVDGDGDLDAVLARIGADRLWLNDGHGTFRDASANVPPTDDATMSVALGDIDGDGDLDAVLGNTASPPPAPAPSTRLWLNDGAGRFTDATHAMPGTPEETYGLALGDLDGDGDLDAVLGNGDPLSRSGERIYTNLTRHLAWRSVPRLGRPIVMDLHGGPQQAWLLCVSCTTASIRLPFGTLRLEPSELFVVGAGLLDPSGLAVTTFMVPRDRALAGVSVQWQALQTPGVLTNLETTTLTGL